MFYFLVFFWDLYLFGVLGCLEPFSIYPPRLACIPLELFSLMHLSELAVYEMNLYLYTIIQSHLNS